METENPLVRALDDKRDSIRLPGLATLSLRFPPARE